jgi:hypothetical protein
MGRTAEGMRWSLYCRAALKELVGDGEYFLGVLPDGSGLAANLVPGQRAPMQLGRQILAQVGLAAAEGKQVPCVFMFVPCSSMPWYLLRLHALGGVQSLV